MSEGNDYRQQAEEAAARVEWCERNCHTNANGTGRLRGFGSH